MKKSAIEAALEYERTKHLKKEKPPKLPKIRKKRDHKKYYAEYTARTKIFHSRAMPDAAADSFVFTAWTMYNLKGGGYILSSRNDRGEVYYKKFSTASELIKELEKVLITGEGFGE